MAHSWRVFKLQSSKVPQKGGGADVAAGAEKNMAKFVDIVRNSPLVKRKGTAGGYEVLASANKDPFIKGISFKMQYYASAEVQDKTNTPAVQEAVFQVCEDVGKSSKSLRKVILTVKAQSIIVTDVATKIKDTYPIHLVAYCGGHGVVEDTFFFIHKTKLDRDMRIEVFKCSSADKVKAVTLTVAKSLNISYKAWAVSKEKPKKVDGSESPALQRKFVAQPGKSNLVKMAPGIATGGIYTPPAPRKPVSEPPGRSRSGSFGDKPPLGPKNPTVVRAVAHNEITGSTHNVLLTDDFDAEFQELAESRVHPEILKTSLATDDVDYFNLDSIKAHIDDETEDQ